VYLKVKNEFEVSLTVYGEDPKLGTEAEQVKKYPWVVLSIDLFISSSGTRIMPPWKPLHAVSLSHSRAATRIRYAN
jgi:hypothetical protein